MVDYGFAQGNDKPTKVEFFDAEMPASVPAKKDPVAVARAAMAKGLEEIGRIKNESDVFEIKSEGDLQLAVELQGQAKTILKRLTDSGESYYKPHFDTYKQIRNIVTATIEPLNDAIKILKQKSDQFAYQLEVQRREAEAKARAEAAALQAKIDKEVAEQRAAEAKAAKAEKREPVEMPPIVVDTPVIPKEIKAKTEHGSIKVSMVLRHEVTELESEYLFGLVLAYCRPAYKTMVDQACKKAIKAGALGVAGGPGVMVREEADTQHRRR